MTGGGGDVDMEDRTGGAGDVASSGPVAIEAAANTTHRLQVVTEQIRKLFTDQGLPTDIVMYVYIFSPAPPVLVLVFLLFWVFWDFLRKAANGFLDLSSADGSPHLYVFFQQCPCTVVLAKPLEFQTCSIYVLGSDPKI